MISEHQIMHTMVEEKFNSSQVVTSTPHIDNKYFDISYMHF